ncbi:MAG TPA: hypothetical protein VH916_01095, partial [Dehalococcoidia bacterium]
ALIVDFDPAAATAVAEFAAAERQCCSRIGWDLQMEPTLRLHISGTPPQLDVLQQLFQEARPT